MNRFTPDERPLYDALCDKAGCGCCAGDVSARENAAMELACELHDKVNGELREHFEALDKSHFAALKDKDNACGYFCGNVPVKSIVAIIEATRTLLQEKP